MAKRKDLPKNSTSQRVRGRMGIFSKLLLFLLGFTALILFLIWLFQICLLDTFYKRTKYDELNRAAEELSAFLEEPDGIPDAVYGYASRYGLCISVYRLDGATASELAKSHVPGDCVLHRLSAAERTALFSEAKANGGSLSKTYPSERHFVERDDASEESFGASEPEAETDVMETVLGSGHVSAEERFNAISFHIVESLAGDTYILILDSRLTPMVSVISTLELQFLWLVAILLVAALLLSVLIARIVSLPFSAMTVSANRLAEGDYGVSFKGSGFRESLELANALNYASEELSKEDTLRRELIANVSHDLRTPLTMVKGYAEVMRDLPGEDTAENIQVVIEEAEYMSLLVTDLLDLSRFELGVQTPVAARFDLCEAIREALSRFERLVHHDGYRITVSSPERAIVLADRGMILRVFYNLISNAINYVGADRTVQVELTAKDEWITVSVTDTGVGISEEALPHIWDRYYKGDKEKRRRMGGTGIGLSIVKNILIAHEARYGVRSKPGEGSTFWFSLPIVTDESDTAELLQKEETNSEA